MNDIDLTPEEKSDIDELTKNLMKKLNDKEVQYIVNLSYWLTKYKEYCDKAIEYLKDESIVYPTAKEWREHLIDILKGENK